MKKYKSFFDLLIILLFFIFFPSCEPTDWEYEYYYYVKIDDTLGNNYNIQVPLPSLQYIKTESKPRTEYLKIFTDSLKIETGQCDYKISEYNNNLFLQIKGNSSVVVSSSFKLWDVKLGTSIAKDSHQITQIFSDNNNIKILIECRAVRKTNEYDTWDFYYSTIIDTSQYTIKFTKESWREKLPDYLLIPLKKGWNKYRVWEKRNKIK